MTQVRAARGVCWLPWTAAAFARARDEDKCVLLSIAAPWSAACRDMDERCYADPAVAAEINRWCVPVRVDADRRPDVADRYDLGGLPTTALLDAEGEILGGGTHVGSERLIEALRYVRESGGARPRRPIEEDPPSRPLDDDELTALVFDAFDREHAGFGTAPKFPLIAPVRLALALYRESESPMMVEYAARTLDVMAWSGLYDEQEGGFFRCAASADWSGPQPGKLLVTNAALVDLYLEAGVSLGNQRWLERAADALAFVQSTLALPPPGGWRASADSDAARLSDANAAMVSAALHAARVFDDGSLRDIAVQALESVLLATYRPGRGLAHCEAGVGGLLSDHVFMAAAHLDAWDATGDVVYQMMAQELVQFVLRTMAAPDGRFRDRAALEGDEPVGRLAYPQHPFVLNCDAAVVLHRLSLVTGDAESHRHAQRTLDALAPHAASQGPLAAHFLLARRQMAR